MAQSAKRETELTDQEYLDHIVADPDSEGSVFARAMHAARYRFAAARVSGRVLEVGCATGYGSEILIAGGAELTGIDLHAAAVAAAQQRNPRGRFVQADATRLPFAASEFAAAVCFDVIEHLEKPAALLDELARVVRPGGRLILSTPNKLASDLSTGTIYPFHVREYYLSEFRAELARFADVELWGQYPSFVDDVRGGAGVYRRESRFWFVPAIVRRHVGGVLRALVYRSMGLGERGEESGQLARMEALSRERVDVAHDFVAVVTVPGKTT